MQIKNVAAKKKFNLQIKNSTRKLKIVHAN